MARLKVIFEINTDLEDEDYVENDSYNTVLLQYQVEEALRNYGLDASKVRIIPNKKI